MVQFAWENETLSNREERGELGLKNATDYKLRDMRNGGSLIVNKEFIISIILNGYEKWRIINC